MPEDRPHRRGAALVAALRAELAAVEPWRACDRAAERAGLGVAATGQAPSPAVARLAVRLERGAARRRGTADPLDEGDGQLDWRRASGHCRIAWLRGRFLARGSLSLAGGRTHLEFVVGPDEAEPLAQRLAELGLPASWRLRRGEGVVTWKSAATVIRFFQLAGATAAVLELEARLVTRALHAELNRALNAETANVERAVAAGARQVAALRALVGEGRLEREPPPLRALAQARLEAPDATLTELAARAGVSRSKAQRGLARLEAMALGRSPSARRVR